MNIELTKVMWSDGKAPGSPQTMSLSFRRQDAPDVADSYTLVTDSLFVLTSGTIVNPPLIKGLENETPYVFRLTNSDVTGGSLDVLYTTPNELVYDALSGQYAPNARIDCVKEDGNFLTGMIPPGGKLFYTLENDFKDYFGNYGNVRLPDNPVLKRISGYTGVYLDSQTSKITLDDISMLDILGSDGKSGYGLGIYFYVSSADLATTGTWPLMTCLDNNGNGIGVYVNNVSKRIIWQQKNVDEGESESITSSTAIIPDSWNKLLIGRSADNLLANQLNYMYLNGASVGNGNITENSIPTTISSTTKLTIGASTWGTGNIGKGTFRNIFVNSGLSQLGDNSGFSVLAPPVGYLQDPYNAGNVITIPHENLIEVTSTKVSFTLPQSLANGSYDFYVKYNNNTSTTTPVRIYVNDISKQTSAYDFNFALADDNGNTIDMFQVNHYALSKNLDGGADGGVVPKNIYFKDGLLVLEAHGDWYDGLLHGVDTDGAAKKHTESGDPLIGEYWNTRVGAAVTTQRYCGYGRYIVEAKLPKQFGVSPFFRLYHHASAKLQDPFYDQCIASGLHQQGNYFEGDGYFVKVKNEWSLELPSNNAVWSFYTVNAMLTASYINPYAGMKVIVQYDTDENNGTYQLNTPAAPNQLSSWTKFSDEMQFLKQPRRDQLKITNARGELGEGVGFTQTPDNQQEEFLEMRASAGKDIWDDAFHEFRIDWYANRVEYYIDGVLIQNNPFYVPDIAGRFSFGLSFPSKPSSLSPWLPDPEQLSAGVAAWHHQAMTVRRVAFTPFTDAVAGGTNRLLGETAPYLGLYRFPFLYG
ncbi:hypothetical protein [Chitinophaga sp. LS1]|uniref:hypothetical protein n=1 Tax=Chitinophaga sp. LS1 TaxID=3051176 RepID=UPI002AAB70AF|nr:hypothetical protein [Chitinophaga sp. LS1]WPV66576.1 family 16 glycosylhydrolase [Chitinophaga sp. LS1]